jgi:catechol 2,3-dioxygenase-like lactoylglutathione lyase family enzyme
MNNTNITALKAHVSIHVRSLEASLDFYRKLFGIEPCKVRRGYAKFDVQNPPLNFSLNEFSLNESSLNEGSVTGSGALSHLGIQVASTEDVLAIRKGWMESGLITRDEMQTDCCYATQDKTWVRDPDGNEWEVFVVLKDNLPEKAAEGKAAEGGCCAPTCCSRKLTNPEPASPEEIVSGGIVR